MPARPAGIAPICPLYNAKVFSGFQGPADTAAGGVAIGGKYFLAHKSISCVAVHIVGKPHQDYLVTRMQQRMLGN
jgi:hypothetical protein